MTSDHAPNDAVCLVTCQKVPLLTDDDRLLHKALAADGWTVDVARWDDPAVDWTHYRASILRSTWDYHLRPDEFRDWLTHCETTGAQLLNPASLVRWNLHKSYLEQLAERGIPVVPTHTLLRGETCHLPRLLDELGWQEIVIKPAISATAYHTFRSSRDHTTEAGARLNDYLNEADYLIQPFVDEITSLGEISFLFFAGEFSHAALKQAQSDDFRVQGDFGGSVTSYEPTASLLAQARRVASTIAEPWLYARIDAVDRGGELVVMEVELIEPQLFLGKHPGSAEALVAAFRRMVERAGDPETTSHNGSNHSISIG